MSFFAVIMPAAGKSSRFRHTHYKKPFAPLAGKAVWLHAAEKFLKREDVKQLILCISPEDREYFDERFAANIAILGVQVVEGGKERADSIENALARVKSNIEYIAVHDAARPAIAETLIDQVFETAKQKKSAILATKVVGTLKKVNQAKQIESTQDRTSLWEAQTPQVFQKEILFKAYAQREGFKATDDAQLVERIGEQIAIVEGSIWNQKITTQADLKFAEYAINALPKPKADLFNHPFVDDQWNELL
ncbi:2-C-methyl-D-erythritol 4-phosphate cytidylyltransferase [Planctomycetales bacterium 10988]|nr:2-C-methyl-D-erythritol 4-phosphate cytidylyltransferase [Planctomycetales bacterium 10988]